MGDDSPETDCDDDVDDEIRHYHNDSRLLARPKEILIDFSTMK